VTSSVVQLQLCYIPTSARLPALRLLAYTAMNHLRFKILATIVIIAACAAARAKSGASSPTVRPQLEKRGNATQLVVDGEPFLILGGEVHNSSSSSVEYMKAVWPRLAAMHMNTVLLPVAWETIEPREGQFDFSNVDGLLEGARANKLKIVLLWFGAWKNTYSSYAPAWVKTDLDRFPRVHLSDGRGTERLSPFSTNVRDSDARAFERLMAHLRDADRNNQTVLLVQVENEVGVIPESRDHSAVAESAFKSQVPPALTAYLQENRAALEPELRDAWESAGEKTAGTWQDVFGAAPLTDDLFMGWQYATYIDRVAAAGKSEYALPMYANAALIRPNYAPGQYNSGGPLPHSLDIWRAAAPALDFFSPDIYFNEFAYWAGRYARPGNPLFIPEAQGGVAGAANALYGFGRLGAIGFSPFGVDEQGNAPLDLAGITNPSEAPDNAAIAAVYESLAQLSPLILDKQSSSSINAVLLEGEAQRSARAYIGDYIATVSRSSGASGMRIAAMFIQTAPNEFLVVGAGEAQVTFTSDKPGLPIVGIESIDEEYFENGTWTPRRRLNGDENSQGQALKLYSTDLAQSRIYRVRLYRYR
jgi:hypothetical protein